MSFTIRKNTVKEFIEQCWAEAYVLWKKGKIRTDVSKEVYKTAQMMQKNALEDDWREGVIADYISDKSEVCIMEIWVEALGRTDKPTLKDSRELGIILDSFEEWERAKSSKVFEEYKSQKYWKRKYTCDEQKIDENYVEIIC